MKAKWTQPALLLSMIIVLAAAALYIKSVDFYGGEEGKSLQAPSVFPGAVLSTEQMQKDLDFLVNTISSIHPALMNGWSSEQKQVITAAYSQIQTPQREADFYFIVDTIVSLVRDGHTNIYWDKQEQEMLDLPLLWIRDGLVVTEDRGDLHIGDIVTAVGGLSIEELEQELTKVVPAENDQWVRMQGTSLLRAAFFLRHLGLIMEDQVEVTVQRGTESISATMPVTGKQLSNEYSPYPKADPPFSYIFEDELSLGIFQLNTCENNRQYQNTVKQFFEDVKARDIKHIAVDLRNNGGGASSVIDEFLSYLDIKSYYNYGALLRYSPQVKEVYGAEQSSGYVESGRQLTQNILKTLRPYKGKLYLLTSPRTFSSANMFAVIVQDNGLGKIIGEATGNQPSSYGDVLGFQLPASGIRFQVSFKKFTRSAPDRDPEDSLHPDIEAYTTVDDIIERRDAQLEKLREVVQAAKHTD